MFRVEFFINMMLEEIDYINVDLYVEKKLWYIIFVINFSISWQKMIFFI